MMLFGDGEIAEKQRVIGKRFGMLRQELRIRMGILHVVLDNRGLFYNFAQDVS